MPTGASDAFRVNYDGSMPAEYRPFSGPDGEDVFAFLGSRRYAESRVPALLNVDGFNYLLNSTRQFAYFRSEFGIDKALFVSELMLVDMTGAKQAQTYFRLYDQFSRSPAGTSTEIP